MSKAGIIEEMMNDSLDSAMDSEDMEEQTEEQVGWAGPGWAGLACFVGVEVAGEVGPGRGWLGSSGSWAAGAGRQLSRGHGRSWRCAAGGAVCALRCGWQLGELHR